MEIKIKEVLDCVGKPGDSPLDNLRGKEMPFSTTLKFKDNVELILNQHKKIEEARDDMISRHTEGKQVIKSNHKNWKKFIKEYEDALESKIELDIKLINKSELTNTLISEYDLEKLEFLINMEE